MLEALFMSTFFVGVQASTIACQSLRGRDLKNILFLNPRQMLFVHNLSESAYRSHSQAVGLPGGMWGFSASSSNDIPYVLAREMLTIELCRLAAVHMDSSLSTHLIVIRGNHPIRAPFR